LVEKVRIECLSCGARRSVSADLAHFDPGECYRCGYVGWARTDDLTEGARKTLRTRPLERRRLRAV
jgi:hypothetical protein